MSEKTNDGLRARCKAFYRQQERNAIMRVGDPVEEIVAFVVAEIGRASDHGLDASLPVCCYFATAEDREEFIAAVQEAKPRMIAKRLP